MAINMAALSESIRSTSTVNWRRSKFVCLAFVVIFVLYIEVPLLRPHKEDFKLLNILCFGDSLTEGRMNRITRAVHPYSIKLQQRFDWLSKKGKHGKFTTKIHNAGLAGEVVQRSMEHRLPVILKGARRKYDWVIILGGTNDISRMLWKDYFEPVDPKAIFDALIGLHRTSHKYGSKSAAVTIPARQCEVKRECSKVREVRKRINLWLREFARSARDQVVLVDLAREMEYPRLRRYWSDELHFTPEGYDNMADITFEVLKQYLTF